MTDEEKILSWQGEKVILLVDRPDDPFTYIAEGLAHGDGTFEYHRDGDPTQGLPKKEYAGKAGVITDITSLLDLIGNKT
jgi:hypothetical protein